MLFNSVDFALFLPIVFILYWGIGQKQIKLQNFLLLASSYFFYGCWDWRFLSLIILSTCLDYTVGIKIEQSKTKRQARKWLLLSLVFNLGCLAFFKYCNFFVENFIAAFNTLGQELNMRSLAIVLPVGISFYTFQTLSYSIDVYKKEIKASRDFVDFAAFVSFFPQLVAGPIERASNLLPQFKIERRFEYAVALNGCKQIIWGLFKKVVIADACAIYVDFAYADIAAQDGSTLLLAAVLFSFQIYCDFSGYSDIAIGVARLFGFKLMQNFAFPYFSRDIAEFWRRWHISLSTWFRDYLYIPLGGSKANKIRNTFIIFIVSGLWHGANWTFLFWGFLNALFFLPLLLRKKNRRYLNIVAEQSVFPTLKETAKIATTFFLCTIAWIFFRAASISEAFYYLESIPNDLFKAPHFHAVLKGLSIPFIVFIFIEWLGRRGAFALDNFLLKKPRLLQYSFYALLLFMIGMFMQTNEKAFIYFQF